jgi:hypothetical protein
MYLRRFPKSASGSSFTPAILSLSALFFTGCGSSFAPTTGTATTLAHAAISGTIHGGQQPVIGASIQLYAAGAPTSGGGFGEGSQPLILLGVLPKTDVNGNFVITGDYVAPKTPSFFYIVATGGHPGVGTPVNPNITLMTTLGGCTPTDGVSPQTGVEINEVTTAASAIALQPFLAPPSVLNALAPAIGAPSTDINGLQNAFQAVNNLVHTPTGVAVTAIEDHYATDDNALLLNTFGDIIASCINSAPLVDTACAKLYFDATPTGGAFPAVDTLQAASYMALNPTNNIPKLFGLITSSAPFVGYSSAPASFSAPLTNANSSCPATIPMGSLLHFELLAGSTITSAAGGQTTVSGGDMGLWPGSAVTGFPPAILETPGVMYLTDPVAQAAQGDLTIAYDAAAGLMHPNLLPADISGYILPPGLYTVTSTLAFSTDITLDAQGDSSAQFIFQIPSALNTGGSTQIHLVNGAQAKNVFWQVGSAATIGGGSTFQGSILAHQAITLNLDVVVHGRALASLAAVTMSGNVTVTAP